MYSRCEFICVIIGYRWIINVQKILWQVSPSRAEQGFVIYVFGTYESVLLVLCLWESFKDLCLSEWFCGVLSNSWVIEYCTLFFGLMFCQEKFTVICAFKILLILISLIVHLWIMEFYSKLLSNFSWVEAT